MITLNYYLINLNKGIADKKIYSEWTKKFRISVCFIKLNTVYLLYSYSVSMYFMLIYYLSNWINKFICFSD